MARFDGMITPPGGHGGGCGVVPRRAALALALLFLVPAEVSTALAAQCDQEAQVVVDRLLSRLRRGPKDLVHAEDSCRMYRDGFYEAVLARQAAAVCKERDAQKNVDRLDALIESVNGLIAGTCSG
jgi:hypothetical protein